MLMVIFGAGASYDSVHPSNLMKGWDENFQPPLAKDLFANKPIQGAAINKYRQVRPIIPRLRKASQEGGPPIERDLEAIQAEAETMPGHHRMLVALRYYLRFLIHTCTSKWHEYGFGVTNYVDLLYRLEQWRSLQKTRICLVSFNYDTLLDTVCEEALGMDLSQVGHYISHENYELIKPHGSVNWGVRLNYDLQGSMEAEDIERLVIDLGRNVDASDDHYLTMGASIQSPFDHSTNCPLVPAIAIPMEQKTETHFVCPSNHLEHLRRAISRTDWLLVIGWRGNEQHFLSLWDEKSPTLRNVLIVGGKDTHEVAEGLNRSGMIRSGCDVRDLKDGFSSFLAGGELESFLGRLD